MLLEDGSGNSSTPRVIKRGRVFLRMNEAADKLSKKSLRGVGSVQGGADSVVCLNTAGRPTPLQGVQPAGPEGVS